MWLGSASFVLHLSLVSACEKTHECTTDGKPQTSCECPVLIWERFYREQYLSVIILCVFPVTVKALIWSGGFYMQDCERQRVDLCGAGKINTIWCCTKAKALSSFILQLQLLCVWRNFFFASHKEEEEEEENPTHCKNMSIFKSTSEAETPSQARWEFGLWAEFTLQRCVNSTGGLPGR